MSELAENTEGGEFEGLPEAAPEADAPEADNEGGSTPAQQSRQNGRDYAPRVDLSDLPEEKRNAIEARFRHLSGQTKREIDRATREWKSIAQQQSEQIEKLTNGFGQVATQLQEKSYSETEAQLTQAADAAFDAGDMKAWREANNKLSNLRVQRGVQEALAERDKALAPKKESKPAAPVETGDVEISPAVASWQEETDDYGAPVRPWAQPEHERYGEAYANLLAIKKSPAMRNYTEAQIMQELDNRMGTKKAASRQNVMGGNLTRGAKASKVSISPKAEEVAVRMKLGGPNATREQHIQAYYKSQLEIAGKKGTR